VTRLQIIDLINDDDDDGVVIIPVASISKLGSLKKSEFWEFSWCCGGRPDFSPPHPSIFSSQDFPLVYYCIDEEITQSFYCDEEGVP
jgi:hypothetical protein